MYLARNSFLTIGGGAGLLPGASGSPSARGFVGVVFEPRVGDSDGDGFPDDIDECPRQAEDVDDFEDGDGCPEKDNDEDGVPDGADRCPLNPEDLDGVDDLDGCPEVAKDDPDGDGILDGVDECPLDPEDRDGVEDSDGCPEAS